MDAPPVSRQVFAVSLFDSFKTVTSASRPSECYRAAPEIAGTGVWRLRMNQLLPSTR